MPESIDTSNRQKDAIPQAIGEEHPIPFVPEPAINSLDRLWNMLGDEPYPRVSLSASDQSHPDTRASPLQPHIPSVNAVYTAERMA